MKSVKEIDIVKTSYSRLNEAALSHEDIEEVNSPLNFYTCWKIKNMHFTFFHFVISQLYRLEVAIFPLAKFPVTQEY